MKKTAITCALLAALSTHVAAMPNHISLGLSQADDLSGMQFTLANLFPEQFGGLFSLNYVSDAKVAPWYDYRGNVGLYHTNFESLGMDFGGTYGLNEHLYLHGTLGYQWVDTSFRSGWDWGYDELDGARLGLGVHIKLQPGLTFGIDHKLQLDSRTNEHFGNITTFSLGWTFH